MRKNICPYALTSAQPSIIIIASCKKKVKCQFILICNIFYRSNAIEKKQGKLFYERDERKEDGPPHKIHEDGDPRRISNAFKKKPIQKITIADICSAAEISRPTFYAHYEDIYALLDEIGENLLASANLREVTNLSIEKQDEITQAILNLVLLIKNNLELYRVCVLERGIASRWPKQITDELNRTLIKKWTEEGKPDENIDKQYIVDFIQASFNSNIHCRIEKGEERETPEALANIIKRFLLHGLSGFVR